MKLTQLLLLTLLLITQRLTAAEPNATAKLVAIKAGHLLDVATGRILDQQAIIVAGEVIPFLYDNRLNMLVRRKWL